MVDSPQSLYPFIDPAREFIDQKDAVTNLQPLRERMQKLVADTKDFDITVYYEFLNTGANISVNPDMRFYGASLVKLPVAMVAMKKVERGEWRMDNELVMLDVDMDSDSGDLYSRGSVGTRFTIEELVKSSLVDSDNTAHKILLRNLTQKEIDELNNVVGTYNLFDDKQELAAKEYARILRSLYTASYLQRDYSQKVLEWMTQATFHDFLSQGMPGAVTFAHKWGEHVDKFVYSDMGIVYYPKRPYVIAVMLHGREALGWEANEARAKSLMAEISRDAYNYMQGI